MMTYSERDNPDVVVEGSTTEFSSVSIALMYRSKELLVSRSLTRDMHPICSENKLST